MHRPEIDLANIGMSFPEDLYWGEISHKLTWMPLKCFQ